MPRYRKLPIEIDAWPCSDIIAAFKRDYWRGLPEPIKTENDTNGNWTVTTRHAPDGEGIYIPTLEGAMFARPGDWIIRGVKGEFYPCKPAVFAATYEPVAEYGLARLREALAPSPDAEPESLEAAERRHIALTLRFTAGNKRRAAELLGIARSTLLHKVRKYGLSPE